MTRSRSLYRHTWCVCVCMCVVVPSAGRWLLLGVGVSASSVCVCVLKLLQGPVGKQSRGAVWTAHRCWHPSVFLPAGADTIRGPPHRMLLAGAIPVVLQKGGQPTCFSTPSSTDPFGLTRFVSDQCCALSVRPLVDQLAGTGFAYTHTRRETFPFPPRMQLAGFSLADTGTKSGFGIMGQPWLNAKPFSAGMPPGQQQHL